MEIVANTVFEPIDFVTLGFKECFTVEIVNSFFDLGARTVVLSDYKGINQIFFLDFTNKEFIYFRPYDAARDDILFNSCLH